MEVKQGRSKTRLLIGITLSAAVILIIAGAVYAVVVASRSGEADKQAEEQNTQVTSDKKVTQQSINDKKTEVDESIKQAQEAHDAAKSAVDDQSKRIKVSQ